MATIESASVPSAISYKNNQPIWDFTEITAYPVQFQQRNGSPTVYVFLSPYAASELKDILKLEVSGYKREKRDVEIVNRDNSIYTPLCDAHFVKLGNVFKKVAGKNIPILDIAEHRAFIDKYPELKPSIVEHTFGGIRRDAPDESDDTAVLDITLDLSDAVKVYQELYDPAKDAIVRVDMTHNHAHPTEAQYREYKNARRNKFLRKPALWTIAESHTTLEKLYDAVIESIDGASVAGDACDAKTKADWLPFVPLWHKLWIVDQIFGELIEKNV